jgi:hypothetical protein
VSQVSAVQVHPFVIDPANSGEALEGQRKQKAPDDPPKSPTHGTALLSTVQDTHRTVESSRARKRKAAHDSGDEARGEKIRRIQVY